MVWSWYYLIPIGIMLIVAAVWLAVFFMSYKNTKNVKTAIAEAKVTIEAFKGDTNMASLKFPSQKAETEEIKATETPVAAENKAAESIEEKGEKAEIKLIDNLLFMAVEEAIDEMTDEAEIKKLLNKLASKLSKG